LEAFAKFGSDLDAATKSVIEKGKRNVEILKQGQNEPMKVEDQVAIIYVGTQGLLGDVPVEKVKQVEKEIIDYLNQKHKDTMDAIRAGKIDDDIKSVIEAAASEMTARFKK
jgi:F-type H+-transporting ATPase subunit alpha